MNKNLIYSFGNILVTTLYPLMVFPYISRVFDVENIGSYNYYNILFSYISLITLFGIGLYASRELGKFADNIPHRNELASELISIIFFNLIVTIFLILLPLYYSLPDKDIPIALLFSLMIVANAISVEWYFVAVENQRFIFFRNLIFKVISLALIFLLIKDNSDLLLYVALVIGGLLLNGIINFIKLYLEIRDSFKFRLNFKHYSGLLIIFLVEITFRYFGMGDITVIEKYITREELGYLTFSLSIFNIISSFLKIIATTLLPRASYLLQNNHIDDFYSLVRKSMSLIFFLGFPAILFLFFGSKFLIIAFGGIKYIPAIPILKLFCPLIILSALINTLIFQVIYPMGKGMKIVIIYIAVIIINILMNIALVNVLNSSALIITSIFSNILLIFLLFVIIRKKISLNNLFSSEILKYLIGFIISFMFVLLLKLYLNESLDILSLFLGISLYLLILFLLKEKLVYSFILNKTSNK